MKKEILGYKVVLTTRTKNLIFHYNKKKNLHVGEDLNYHETNISSHLQSNHEIRISNDKDSNHLQSNHEITISNNKYIRMELLYILFLLLFVLLSNLINYYQVNYD